MRVLSIIVLITCFVIAPLMAEHEGLDIRVLESKQLFHELNEKINHFIPPDTLKNSNAVIFFPGLIKAGFLYAGKFGLGLAMARNPETGKWGAPCFVRISGGSFGYQAGAQKTELILVGRDGFDFKDFEPGATFSGSASAAAGPWGVYSEIGTGWQLNSKFHWYSFNKGLFASFSLDGSVLNFDDNANKAYYGDEASPQDILFGKVEPKFTGKMLIEALEDYENNHQVTPRLTIEEPGKEMQTWDNSDQSIQSKQVHHSKIYYSDSKENSSKTYQKYYDPQRQQYYLSRAVR